MSTTTLKNLVEKLDQQSRLSLEAATARCQSRSHYNVEIEHWLLAMLEQPQSDLTLILSHYNLSADAVSQQLQQALESMKTGNDSLPGISMQLIDLLRRAWLNTTIEFSGQRIRSAYVLYTLLKDDSMSALLLRRVPLFERIDVSALGVDIPTLLIDSDENNSKTSVNSTGKNTPALDQFTTDLTQLARDGKIDPIVGRDNEIRQMMDILTRRRQNNPILTGEAGVGKTAVVEGLALKIAAQQVPEKLKLVSLRVLDLALLQAGAGIKGEFENRLKSIIKEVNASQTPIILFIDEAHTMIGSGGQAGQNDAANLLKPALARGELRTIAATTWAEYKKFFEKDAALSRRFQVVTVEEPTPELAVEMMRGLLPVMEQHHGVSITEQALTAAVNLSHRYINGRQLPDKAVGLLDTACARVAMSQQALPASIEVLQRKLVDVNQQLTILQREQRQGANHDELLQQINSKKRAAEQELEVINQQWSQQKALVEEANALSLQLNTEQHADNALPLSRLMQIKADLYEISAPMVHWQVNDELVAEVVSDWTGIPLGKMQANEINTVLSLEQSLATRIVGQQHALQLISRIVQTSRAQLADENKPNGVFLLTGPSGVGKTETALALAEQVYGSEDQLTVINMSEFKEEHKVSMLLGAPPGYVGYGEGGVLTEAVRRKPYSVILLDEMEKAHPGVQDIFYQIFDKGTVKDGEGRDIDFRNTIIIMTSNAGTETTMRLCEDPDTAPTSSGLVRALNDDLLHYFKPAFLGRLHIIPYLPLSQSELSLITRLQLARIEKRLKQHYRAGFHYKDEVCDHIVTQCQDAGAGARTIHNIIQQQLLPDLAIGVLQRVAQQQPVTDVCLAVDAAEFKYHFK